MRRVALLLLSLALACGCGGADASRSHTRAVGSSTEEEADVRRTLDAWHEAAARSDEEAYFALMTDDAIFLGTDATERWTRDQFRAYAHAPFSEGRGWRMRAIRRDVVMAGAVAWFDEDLETVNLGPARGSGVLVLDRSFEWRIAHYNLTITVPNDRFDGVRALLAAPPAPVAP